MFGDLLILGIFLLLAVLVVAPAVVVIRSWRLVRAARTPVAGHDFPDLKV